MAGLSWRVRVPGCLGLGKKTTSEVVKPSKPRIQGCRRILGLQSSFVQMAARVQNVSPCGTPPAGSRRHRPGSLERGSQRLSGLRATVIKTGAGERHPPCSQRALEVALCLDERRSNRDACRSSIQRAPPRAADASLTSDKNRCHKRAESPCNCEVPVGPAPAKLLAAIDMHSRAASASRPGRWCGRMP